MTATLPKSDGDIDFDSFMPDLPNKARFTPREAAGYLGVHRNTIYRWIDEGKIDGAVMVGVKLKWIPRQAILDQFRVA